MKFLKRNANVILLCLFEALFHTNAKVGLHMPKANVYAMKK